MTADVLINYHDEVKKCEKLEDLKPVCEEFCRSHSFEYYLFGVIDATSLSSPKITTITNYPNGWWSSYFKENMQKCDPIVRYCFENSTPIRWDKLMQLEGYISPDAERMMATASSFGLSYGMSIPIKSPSGETAIFSLASSCSDNLDSRFIDVLPHAQAISHSFLETYIRLKCEVVNTKIELTNREQECIFWACEGKTAWEISQIIAVSERTVIFHMTNATKKLGATNRQHAVAKAIMLGLVKPIV